MFGTCSPLSVRLKLVLFDFTHVDATVNIARIAILEARSVNVALVQAPSDSDNDVIYSVVFYLRESI